MPGSDDEVRQAAEYAKVVAVARVIEAVEGGVGEPGSRPYHAKVAIERCLKGEAAGEPFVYLVVRAAPNGRAEQVPEEGRDFLFFLSQRPGEQMGVIKTVRPAEPMLRRVEEFLVQFQG